MKLSVRPLEQPDLKDVLRIEESCFPRAWTPAQFRRFLAADCVHGFVVQADGQARGFYVVEPELLRLRVLNLAVDPAVRRRGVAMFILGEIEALARAAGLRRIELEVHETNLAAQLLYRKAGYRAVGILRSHYGKEDGYLMRREIATP